MKTGSRVPARRKAVALGRVADGNRRSLHGRKEREKEEERLKRGARFFPITQSRPLRRTRMSRKVRPLETCGASRCTTNRRGTKVPVLHFAAPRPTQPADALTSENRLKGVALDRLHRRLIDAPANNNPAGPARTASTGSTSLFIFFLRPGALATIPMCIKAPVLVRTYPRQHYRAYAARCDLASPHPREPGREEIS